MALSKLGGPAAPAQAGRSGPNAAPRPGEQVIAPLRGHARELRASGVARLSLFGSTARGDERPDSDIDLLAAFDHTRPLSILAVAGIERQISQTLSRPVELVEETP